MNKGDNKEACVQHWLSRAKHCKTGATSLAESEMGPFQGGAFLESPALTCGSTYNPAMMNDVDTFARAGQYYDRDNCEHLAAQYLCNIFGLPGSIGETEEAPVLKEEKALDSKQKCFCSIVQGCTMQTMVHFNQRSAKEQ